MAKISRPSGEVMQLPPAATELDAEAIASRLEEGLGDGLIETVINHGQVTARVIPDFWVNAARFVKTDEQLTCTFFSWLSAIHWIEEAFPEGEVQAREDNSEVQSELPTDPTESDSGSGNTSDDVQESDANSTVSEFAPYPSTHVPGTYEQPRGRLFQLVMQVSAPASSVSVLLKTELPETDARISTLTDVFAGANWHERECHEMFGIVFDGHPDLSKLYLPEDFEGHPLLKSFSLGARLVKPWPGNIDVEEIPPEIEARLDAEFATGTSTTATADDGDEGGDSE